MKTFILVISSLSLAASITGADTNVIYSFVDSRGAMGQEARVYAYERQMEAAKTLPECRAAELDPQGNWGEICAGFQLSLRFPTNVFIAGQPIGVSVILRNTTTNSVVAPGPVDWFMYFFVLRQDDRLLRRTKSPKWVLSGGGDMGLPPRSQTRLTYTLNEIFDLTSPGKYRVYVEQRNPKWPELQRTRSGTAEIMIVGPATQ